MRAVRRVVTGALEIERKFGRIGSSLEAAPRVYIADRDLRDALAGVDLAEVAITSGIEVIAGDGPEGAFRLEEVPGIAVVVRPRARNEMRPLVENPRERRRRSRIPRAFPA